MQQKQKRTLKTNPYTPQLQCTVSFQIIIHDSVFSLGVLGWKAAWLNLLENCCCLASNPKN